MKRRREEREEIHKAYWHSSLHCFGVYFNVNTFGAPNKMLYVLIPFTVSFYTFYFTFYCATLCATYTNLPIVALRNESVY